MEWRHNHSHDLKNVFKGAATQASHSSDALGDFYQDLLAKGMKPAMAINCGGLSLWFGCDGNLNVSTLFEFYIIAMFVS
jgi:hypothetical protein